MAILYVGVNNVQCITTYGEYIIQVPLVTKNWQNKISAAVACKNQKVFYFVNIHEI